tara:strand:+ start:105 stop:551 length:447 start_codon:yes stop_codon:yes gene_type:complete
MPYTPLTDEERKRVKKVRKVEAGGAPRGKPLYAFQNTDTGKWVVYGKSTALQAVRDQIRDNTLPDVRPFDRLDYALEDDDSATAPEINENNENDDQDESGMSSPAATLLELSEKADVEWPSLSSPRVSTPRRRRSELNSGDERVSSVP